jgi:hypothetical protein
MQELYLYVTLNGYQILTALTQIIAGASVIANITPTKKDNKILGSISVIVNTLAMNWAVKPVSKSKLNE